MRLLLATGSESINQFIFDNVVGVSIAGIAGCIEAVLRQVEEREPDIIVLSLLLPGGENILDAIFQVFMAKECRIIILAESRTPVLNDLFYMGIRDFIFDPIDPHLLMQRIYTPATFKEAVLNLNPGKPSKKFRRLIAGLIRQNRPAVTREISRNAEMVVEGLLKLLGRAKKETLEDNLYEIEQGVVEVVLEVET